MSAACCWPARRQIGVMSRSICRWVRDAAPSGARPDRRRGARDWPAAGWPWRCTSGRAPVRGNHAVADPCAPAEPAARRGVIGVIVAAGVAIRPSARHRPRDLGQPARSGRRPEGREPRSSRGRGLDPIRHFWSPRRFVFRSRSWSARHCSRAASTRSPQLTSVFPRDAWWPWTSTSSHRSRR